MKALHGGRTKEFQDEYHLGRNDAPEFDQGQPHRIALGREYIGKILHQDPSVRTIVELGCGAGDVSGPFAQGTPYKGIDTTSLQVIGYDFVPIAEEKCNQRWPGMDFRLANVADVPPFACDILVMTEFLEHVVDSLLIADTWLAKAKWAVIGHPLDEPEPFVEYGHVWSYAFDDWQAWFTRSRMTAIDHAIFSMGPFPKMIIGYGGQ